MLRMISIVWLFFQVTHVESHALE